MTTRVGRLVLSVPQVREGKFSPELFARFQRSEQALILALMEMVLEEVRRRERVIRIFPNVESAKRLLGALLMEKDEGLVNRPAVFRYEGVCRVETRANGDDDQRITTGRRRAVLGMCYISVHRRAFCRQERT